MPLPTLKETHQTRQDQWVKLMLEHPERLREAIDQHLIDDMDTSLKKLEKLLSEPDFAKLGTLHFGLQKAHSELVKVLDYGPIRQWASEQMPSGFTALGRLNIFTTGLSKFLKQLPKVIDIVKGSMNDYRRASWDPNKPMDELLDVPTKKRLRNIIMKAMTPGQSFNFLGSKGLPYVNDNEMISEILSLSFNQVSKLGEIAGQMSNLSPPSATPQIASDIKAVVSPSTEAVPVEKKQGPAVPANKPAILPNAPAGAPATPGMRPLRAVAVEAEIDKLYDETFKNNYGEARRMTKPDAAFKALLAKQVASWLKSKGHAF